MTAGSHQDLLTHGRKHLLPYFASLRLSEIDEESVRDWLATMARQVEEGELSAKTVNNARTCLSVALNEAARRGLVTRRAGEREFPAPQRLRRTRLTISTSRLSARYSAACMTARIVPPMPHALASRIVTLSPAGSRA